MKSRMAAFPVVLNIIVIPCIAPPVTTRDIIEEAFLLLECTCSAGCWMMFSTDSTKRGANPY